MFEPLFSIQFDHEEQTRKARLLGILLVGQVIGSMAFVLLFVLLWLFYPSFPFFPLLFPLLSGLSCLPVYWLLRQGRLGLAGYALIISNFVCITGAMYTVGGFRGPAPIIYFWPIVAAGMAINLRASLVFATASTFLYLALAVIELRGLYSPPMPSDAATLFAADLGIPVFMFFLLAFLSWLSAGSLRQALQKARQRAADLDAQLRENEVLTSKLQSQLERNELLIGQLQETTNVLAPAAEELSAASEETNATAEQIAFTVQQVAHGAQVQAERSEAISRATEQVAASTRQIAANAETTGQATAQAGEMVCGLAQALRTLGDKAQEIDKIVTIVEKFADQTNLLALNAAIEAARAGEQGRGFAVVADEVRRLAESSARSVEEIAALTAEIRGEMERLAASTEDVIEAVNQSAELAEATVVATRQQEAETKKVVQAIGEVASVAEENAAAAEEVSAAVEEQTASMEEISVAAQELAEMAERLRATVIRFDMGEPQ